MPSRPRQWREAFSYVPGYSGPGDTTRRPCDCRADPVVFGHEPECPAAAGAA